MPGGASVGSVAVGRVTSSDGSLISRPSSMISVNVRSHAAPKEIVWCAVSGRRVRSPACSTTALGDHRSGTGRRRVRPTSASTTGRSGVSTTASHGSASLSSAGSAVAAVPHRGDPTVAALPAP